MVQEMGQDGVSHTYTPYKRPSLIQRLFARKSTEVDVEGLSSQQMLTKEKTLLAKLRGIHISFSSPLHNKCITKFNNTAN